MLGLPPLEIQLVQTRSCQKKGHGQEPAQRDPKVGLRRVASKQPFWDWDGLIMPISTSNLAVHNYNNMLKHEFYCY